MANGAKIEIPFASRKYAAALAAARPLAGALLLTRFRLPECRVALRLRSWCIVTAAERPDGWAASPDTYRPTLGALRLDIRSRGWSAVEALDWLFGYPMLFRIAEWNWPRPLHMLLRSTGRELLKKRHRLVLANACFSLFADPEDPEVGLW